MKFVWDSNKAPINKRKHKISFIEAVTAIRDPLAATNKDPDPSFDEERYITIGISMRGRLLTVLHTEEEDIIRIISAPLATRGERKIYEEDETTR